MRILPLGDSITDGFNVPGGYRVRLAALLHGAGYRFTYVGSSENGPPALRERRHEGHPGFRIDEIDSRASEWIRSTKPDVVLLLAGTNDLLQNVTPSDAATHLAILISRVRQQAPKAHIFVSSLPPSWEPWAGAPIATYNESVSQLVHTRARTDPRLVFVDTNRHLELSDLADGVHPTEAGYGKIANAWFQAIHNVKALECARKR